MTSDLQKRGGRPRCHPSPHPRKHSLDFHLRPVAIPLCDPAVPSPFSGYQVPRPASTPQPLSSRRPSSTPSVDSLTQAELHASTPTPPPRPPKPPGESPGVGTGPSTLPRSTSESDSRDGCVEAGGGGPRSSPVTAPGRPQSGQQQAVCIIIIRPGGGRRTDRVTGLNFRFCFRWRVLLHPSLAVRQGEHVRVQRELQQLLRESQCPSNPVTPILHHLNRSLFSPSLIKGWSLWAAFVPRTTTWTRTTSR